MGLRHVFLDFGNTLVREEPSRFEIYAQAARSLGAQVTEEGMRDLMVRAHRALPREIDGHWRYSDPWFRFYIEWIFGGELGLVPNDWVRFQSELFARFSDVRTFRLFPGTRQLLSDLRAAGLQIGIISNWSPRLPALIEGLGLSDAFEVVLSSAIERAEKPEAAIFERALERSGARPEDSLHAGDHPENDLRAASALGMHAVLVDHADEHATISPRVRSLAELARHALALRS